MSVQPPNAASGVKPASASVFQPPAVVFDRDICSSLEAGEPREWLVTNGIGGFASGTLAGVLTRRYHGLLVAALKPTAHVQVEYLGSRSDAVELPISQVAPAIFTSDASGRGQAAVINQDGSLNSTAHPAPRGSIISIYCTGEGQTNPPGVDGKISDAILPRPLVPVSVKIGDITVVPAYAGGAGAAIAGALQINVKIPDSIAPNNLVPVTIQIGAAVSQPNVTIAVN